MCEGDYVTVRLLFSYVRVCEGECVRVRLLFSYVSVKNSLRGIGSVCLHMASSFSLSERGTECTGGMYF